MALIGDGQRGDTFSQNNADGDNQNLWSSILAEAQSHNTSKLPSSKSILLLGDNDTGKTTLVAKLQGTEDPRKGAGLEYHTIDVKDEYRDDHARVGVWILDGDPHHTGLLRFALTQENFANSIVLLVASMSSPWSIIDSLKKWSTLLQDHIDKLRIPREQLREYEQSLVRHFQEYVEPSGDPSNVQSPPRRGPNPLHPSAPSEGDQDVLLPLGENTLTNNLGIPIVVVITKSDAISTLEKEHDFKEEHFDFIQENIRKFCLNYKNCDLLRNYLIHRIFGFPFQESAFVIERDAVFIPAGWDKDSKISILHETMSNIQPEDPYDDVIVKPNLRKPLQREAETLAEDEQVFLMKQQTKLSKEPKADIGRESPMRTTAAMGKTASPKIGTSPSGTPSPGKKLDGTGVPGKPGVPGAANEGVLANFFNSLLNKKTGAVSPKTGTDKATVSRDAAAELDRMNRQQKKPVPGQAPNSTGQ
ncbi:unnamed protein product [Owenia fusiformis]|uniref:Dynein light intermediate chain n=1 Tax=Owenia fusiformis TaxID=6347 RepID=A0A8J1USQ2_OWEFU|nr:unnamed protein product [Owenia fusiformis]